MLRLSFVAVALLLFVSCTDPAAPEEDLFVTTSVTPSRLGFGETAEVVVTIVNQGSRTHSVDDDACRLPFMVYTEDGTVVGPPYIQICLLIWTPPKKLPPGERLVLTAYWHGDGFSELLPGTYLLRGSVDAIGAGHPVTGAPVAVTITE